MNWLQLNKPKLYELRKKPNLQIVSNVEKKVLAEYNAPEVTHYIGEIVFCGLTKNRDLLDL